MTGIDGGSNEPAGRLDDSHQHHIFVALIPGIPDGLRNRVESRVGKLPNTDKLELVSRNVETGRKGFRTEKDRTLLLLESLNEPGIITLRTLFIQSTTII